MIKKYISFLLILCNIWSHCFGQSYTLQECIAKANSNSSSTKLLPLIQEELKQKNEVSDLSNLPKLALNGGATYQSAVTSLPIKLPNVTIVPPQKDQYKVTLDLQQNLYDGGLLKANKKVNAASAMVDESQIENDNFLISEQVTAIYYNVLMAQTMTQNLIYVETQLQSKITKIENNIANGTASKSDLLQLKSSLIELNQQKNDLMHNKQGAVDALGIWLGEKLTENFTPKEDAQVQLGLENKITRPEIKLTNARQALILANKELIDAKYTPKLSLFATGAYGRPGLNFLSNSFSFYGIGGLNLRVPLEHFILKSNNKEKNLLDIQASKLNTQIEQINARQNSLLSLKLQEIHRLEDNIKTDAALILIKSDIAKIADVRHNEGIATTTDYTDAIQAELLAKNNLVLHKAQLALAKTQYNQLKGINF